MITEETQKLWDAYLVAETDRIRSLTMSALDRFLEAALRHESPVWYAWAYELAHKVSDEQQDIPIRFPLFQRMLLPALTHGILHEARGCARWLAHFDQLLFHSVHHELPNHLRSAEGLLREALRVDPEDQLARRSLVERWANYLEYTLHELPAGVLYGNNGASVKECEELLELLDEFIAHVKYLGRTVEYSELVGDCLLHFKNYREYLLTRLPDDCYEQFLERCHQAGQ
jgi:hypothetical protein